MIKVIKVLNDKIKEIEKAIEHDQECINHTIKILENMLHGVRLSKKLIEETLLIIGWSC